MVQAQVGFLLAGPGVLLRSAVAHGHRAFYSVVPPLPGSRRPALDMSRNDPPSDYLADGIHYRGQSGKQVLFFATGAEAGRWLVWASRGSASDLLG